MVARAIDRDRVVEHVAAVAVADLLACDPDMLVDPRRGAARDDRGRLADRSSPVGDPQDDLMDEVEVEPAGHPSLFVVRPARADDADDVGQLRIGEDAHLTSVGTNWQDARVARGQ